MRISLLLASMLLSMAALWAQDPGMNRNRSDGQQMTGRFYGKVVDADNKGLETAYVVLVQD